MYGRGVDTSRRTTLWLFWLMFFACMAGLVVQQAAKAHDRIAEREAAYNRATGAKEDKGVPLVSRDGASWLNVEG